jgi:hypothetical protein
MNKDFYNWLKQQKYSWNGIPKNIGADYNNVAGWVLYSVMADVVGEKNMIGKPVWVWGQVLEIEIGNDDKIKYERGFRTMA